MLSLLWVSGCVIRFEFGGWAWWFRFSVWLCCFWVCVGYGLQVYGLITLVFGLL